MLNNDARREEHCSGAGGGWGARRPMSQPQPLPWPPCLEGGFGVGAAVPVGGRGGAAQTYMFRHVQRQHPLLHNAKGPPRKPPPTPPSAGVRDPPTPAGAIFRPPKRHVGGCGYGCGAGQARVDCGALMWRVVMAGMGPQRVSSAVASH